MWPLGRRASVLITYEGNLTRKLTMNRVLAGILADKSARNEASMEKLALSSGAAMTPWSSVESE
jgi:hypothetical protein